MGWIRNYFREKNIERTERNLHSISNKYLLKCSENSFHLKDGVCEVLFKEMGRRIEAEGIWEK